MPVKRSVTIKPSDPLLTTRWFDVTAAVLWAIYAIWGIAAFLSQLPSFQFVGAPHWYGAAWAGAVGVTALVASLAATSIFFDIRHLAQVTKKRIERDALAVFCALIFVIHVVSIWTFFSGHWAYFANVFLTFSYYIVPAFRIYHLSRRIRVLSGRLP